MKVYILFQQIYEECYVIAVCSSKEKAEAILEEERQKSEKDFPGGWELGGWKEEPDYSKPVVWNNGHYDVQYNKVRNGEAFKNDYRIEEHEVD